MLLCNFTRRSQTCVSIIHYPQSNHINYSRQTVCNIQQWAPLEYICCGKEFTSYSRWAAHVQMHAAIIMMGDDAPHKIHSINFVCDTKSALHLMRNTKRIVCRQTNATHITCDYELSDESMCIHVLFSHWGIGNYRTCVNRDNIAYRLPRRCLS